MRSGSRRRPGVTGAAKHGCADGIDLGAWFRAPWQAAAGRKVGRNRPDLQLPPAILAALLDVLEDDTGDDGVVFDLVHRMEDEDWAEYVRAVYEGLGQLRARRARLWADTLVCRIINNERTRALLMAEVETHDAAPREALIAQLDEIGQGTQAVAGHARDVLERIQQARP